MSAVNVQPHELRMAHLARANWIRSERSALKRRLRELIGDHDAVAGLLARIVARPPEWATTMKLRDLLMAAPWWGRVKADRFLRQARIGAAKTLGGLSERQREQIIDLLEMDASR